MATTLICAVAWASSAVPSPSTLSPLAEETSVDYIDENGDSKQASNVTVLDASTTEWNGTTTGGWYCTSINDVSYNDPVTVDGDVKLILKDAGSATIPRLEAGLTISPGGKLTIYGQSGQSGEIWIFGIESPITGSELTINGGNVLLEGESAAPLASSPNFGDKYTHVCFERSDTSIFEMSGQLPGTSVDWDDHISLGIDYATLKSVTVVANPSTIEPGGTSALSVSGTFERPRDGELEAEISTLVGPSFSVSPDSTPGTEVAGSVLSVGLMETSRSLTVSATLDAQQQIKTAFPDFDTVTPALVKVEGYGITLDAGEGTLEGPSETVTDAEGAVPELPTPAPPTGKILIGWYQTTEPGERTPVIPGMTRLAAPTTLTAMYGTASATVSPAEATVSVGGTTQLTAIVTVMPDEAGLTMPPGFTASQAVSWSVSAGGGFATVDGAGRVSGRQAGIATVTATPVSGGSPGSTEVRIVAVPTPPTPSGPPAPAPTSGGGNEGTIMPVDGNAVPGTGDNSLLTIGLMGVVSLVALASGRALLRRQVACHGR